MFLQTQNTNSDSELKNALFTFTIQCIYNCSDSLFCAIRTYRFWRRKPSKHFETQTIEQLEIPTQKCCINFIIKCFYKLKIQIQTQSSKICSFYIYNSMYLQLFWLTHFCAIRAYRFWRRKPSKHFETQTIEQLEIPTQKRCIHFIIECFYKLKIQIQTQRSKMLFLHLQFNVFTTVLTHFFVPSGHISVWRTKPSKDFETIYRTAQNTE